MNQPASLFGPTARKWALTFHLLSIGIWMGAAIAMMTIALLRPSRPASDAGLLAYCLAIKLIDDWVIIASAGASLISGLLLSWKTKWGFFTWYWVAFKLVSTVIMVTFGATCLGPWINATASLAETQGLAAMDNPEFTSDIDSVRIWGTLQILLLVILIVVSVFKPWGKLRR